MNGMKEMADIVAEIRAYGSRPPPRGAWLDLADRIEEWMRDIPHPSPNWKDICAKCKDGDIEPTFCAYYSEPNGCNSPIIGTHPTTERLSAVGNIAAMRKALVSIRDRVLSGGFDGISPADIVNICDAALAKPPRNCDVGTAEEHGERCLAQFNQWRRNGDGRKLITAIMEWAQAPYAKDTKGKGDVGNQQKMRDALLEMSRIKPCICSGPGPICDTRRTEFPGGLIMPLVEYKLRCEACGRATRWHEDCVKAEAEWNEIAGSPDECDRPD